MKNFLYFPFIIAVSFLLILTVGCGKQSKMISSPERTQNKIIIGYAQLGSESAWRNANSASIKEAAKDAGVILLFKNAENDQNEQKRIIQEFIIQRVDIIILPPIVANGWDDILKEAKDAGIPVILSDRSIQTNNPNLYVTIICSDFKAEGRKAANWLVKETRHSRKKINVFEIEGTIGSSPAIDRKKGFDNIVLKQPNMKILGSVSGNFIKAGGKQVMASALKKYGKKINLVFAHNDDMALGAVEAIKEYGLKPGQDIKIISIDGTKAAVQAIIDGKVNLVVECSPLLGPQMIKAALDLKAGKKIPRRINPVEKVFTKENAAQEIKSRKY